MNMHAQVSVYGLIGVHVELMSGSVGGCVSLTEVQTCGLCCSGSLTCRPDRSMRSWFDFRVHTVHVVRGNTDCMMLLYHHSLRVFALLKLLRCLLTIPCFRRLFRLRLARNYKHKKDLTKDHLKDKS